MKKLLFLLLICLSSCAKDDIFIDIVPINKQLYLTDGTLFANNHNRVINSKYGEYIEFEREQILVELIEDVQYNANDFCLWYYPKGKYRYMIRCQKSILPNSNFLIGKYYISVYYFMNYNDLK